MQDILLFYVPLVLLFHSFMFLLLYFLLLSFSTFDCFIIYCSNSILLLFYFSTFSVLLSTVLLFTFLLSTVLLINFSLILSLRCFSFLLFQYPLFFFYCCCNLGFCLGLVDLALYVWLMWICNLPLFKKKIVWFW